MIINRNKNFHSQSNRCPSMDINDVCRWWRCRMRCWGWGASVVVEFMNRGKITTWSSWRTVHRLFDRKFMRWIALWINRTSNNFCFMIVDTFNNWMIFFLPSFHSFSCDKHFLISNFLVSFLSRLDEEDKEKGCKKKKKKRKKKRRRRRMEEKEEEWKRKKKKNGRERRGNWWLIQESGKVNEWEDWNSKNRIGLILTFIIFPSGHKFLMLYLFESKLEQSFLTFDPAFSSWIT